MSRAAAMLMLMLMLAAGCGGGAAGHIRLAPEEADTAGPAALYVDGVAVDPPAWVEADDLDALADAVRIYLADASAALAWPIPPGDAHTLPLRIALHGVAGLNLWQQQTRTAWLYWPHGPSGRPLLAMFAPLLAQVVVLDRRALLGLAGPWTQADLACAARGRSLPVALATHHPGDYE